MEEDEDDVYPTPSEEVLGSTIREFRIQMMQELTKIEKNETEDDEFMES